MTCSGVCFFIGISHPFIQPRSNLTPGPVFGGQATLMMSFGVNPKVVGEMLGHSTIATTMDIYSHVPLGLQRDAARTLQEGL